MAFGQDFEFADKICMTPERKVCLDSFLQAEQPKLLKSSSFCLRERLIQHVGKGWPSPENERRAQ